MIDNKPLELEALHLCQFHVSKNGFKYNNPNYDENGGDFLISEEIREGLFKIIICQSKGRNITENNSFITIDKNYVQSNFLLFVYLKNDKWDNDNEKILLFNKGDIENWELKKDENYYLYIPKNALKTSKFKDYFLNKVNSSKIGQILDTLGESSKIEYKTIMNLGSLSSLLELWKNYGSIPDHKLAKQLLDDFDNFPYIILEQFIFLLCITVANENKLEFADSIDWSFQYLKNYREILPVEDVSKFKIEKEIFPNFMVTYNKTILRYVENDGDHGFYLRIGDIEEYFDCYIFQSGKYYLKYNLTVKNY